MLLNCFRNTKHAAQWGGGIISVSFWSKKALNKDWAESTGIIDKIHLIKSILCNPVWKLQIMVRSELINFKGFTNIWVKNSSVLNEKMIKDKLPGDFWRYKNMVLSGPGTWRLTFYQQHYPRDCHTPSPCGQSEDGENRYEGSTWSNRRPEYIHIFPVREAAIEESTGEECNATCYLGWLSALSSRSTCRTTSAKLTSALCEEQRTLVSPQWSRFIPHYLI